MTKCTEIDSLIRTLSIQLPSPEQRLNLDCKNANQVEIWIKRDDLIHAVISGNKWRKLSNILRIALQSPPAKIISFGGGYSNHIHALAYCCNVLKIPFLAYIRGNYAQNMTPMLTDIHRWGAQIEWVDKVTYAKRAEPSYISQLNAQYPNSMIIPEGGSQQAALQGVSSIVNELIQPYDLIAAPVASGGTIAGLIHASHNMDTSVLGIAVLKGHDYLYDLVNQFLPAKMKTASDETGASAKWQINSEFHFGGYAKKPAELLAFCNNFQQHNKIELEPIYSGKLFFALSQLIEKNYFPKYTKILALHTGGLQGIRP